MRNCIKTLNDLFWIGCLIGLLTTNSEGQEISHHGARLDNPIRVPLKFSRSENLCRSEIPLTERVRGTVWEVFPVKNEIRLYDYPQGDQVVSQADIGDHFVVYEEQGGYFLLGSGPTWGEQREGMKLRGWAQKSDFLLHRMAQKKQGIWRKAMVVNFIPSGDQFQLKDQDFEIAPIFPNPECEGEPLGKIRVLRFLFVYDTFPACSDEPTSILVGEKPVLTRKEDLLGWIPIHRLTLWDTREALELNFDPAAQANREASFLPASVFDNLQSAYQYAANKSQHNTEFLESSRISQEDFSQKYWPPQILRYPILRRIDMKNLRMEERDDIYEIGFIGNTIKLGGQDESYEGEISREMAAEQQQALEQTFQSFSKLDILFVVDATSSMGPYLKATAESIKESMKSISNHYSADWDIRFAGAVYRDYEDEKSDKLFAHQDLTGEQQIVIDFFENEKERSADTDYPEALYYGLKNAISATHFRPQSMRYVVLISDAGNHDPDKREITPDWVSDALYDNQCHFLCIRVAPNSNSGQEAGPLLKEQTREWILDISNQAQADIHRRISNVQNQFSSYLSAPQLRDLGDLMLMVGSHVLGAYVVADNSDDTQSYIEKYLAKAVEIHDAFRDVTRLLATGASLGEAVIALQRNAGSPSANDGLGSGAISDGLTGMAYDQVWLRHILSRVPNAEDLLQRRVTIYRRAYVNMFSENLKEPLFRPVVLMTASALSTLINLIEDLVSSADTERLSETWRKVLDALSGEEGVHKSVSDYARQRLSLPVNSDLLKLSLPQLDEMSNLKTRQLITDISQKKSQLEKILYDDSPDQRRWFLMSEVKYYWIRVDELP